MKTIPLAMSLAATALMGCSKTSCSVEMGDSSMELKSNGGSWAIAGLTCDGVKSTQEFNATEYIDGSCSRLDDTDYGLYWKFRLGMLCYPEFSTLLQAKADATLTSSFVLATR